MKLLLDTHILLWAALEELPETAKRYISDSDYTLLFSPASIWEVAIKSKSKRADFILEPAALYHGLLDAGYEELPISSQHALFTATLPPLHKDPFDRILLAQATYEGIPLLTADRVLASYPGSVIYVG